MELDRANLLLIEAINAFRDKEYSEIYEHHGMTRTDIQETELFHTIFGLFRQGAPPEVVATTIHLYNRADKTSVNYESSVWKDNEFMRQTHSSVIHQVFVEAWNEFNKAKLRDAMKEETRGAGPGLYANVMKGFVPQMTYGVSGFIKLCNPPLRSGYLPIMLACFKVLLGAISAPRQYSEYIPAILLLNFWKRLMGAFDGGIMDFSTVRSNANAHYQAIDHVFQVLMEFDRRNTTNAFFKKAETLPSRAIKIKQLLAAEFPDVDKLKNKCAKYCDYFFKYNLADRCDFTFDEIRRLAEFGITMEFDGWSYVDKLVLKRLHLKPFVQKSYLRGGDAPLQFGYIFPTYQDLASDLAHLDSAELADQTCNYYEPVLNAFNIFLDVFLPFHFIEAYAEYRRQLPPQDISHFVKINTGLDMINELRVSPGRPVDDYRNMLISMELPCALSRLTDKESFIRAMGNCERQGSTRRGPYRATTVDGAISCGKSRLLKQVSDLSMKYGIPARIGWEPLSVIKSLSEKTAQQQAKCLIHINECVKFCDFCERNAVSSGVFNLLSGNVYNTNKPINGSGYSVYRVSRDVQDRITSHFISGKFVMWDKLKEEKDFAIDQLANYFTAAFSICATASRLLTPGRGKEDDFVSLGQDDTRVMNLPMNEKFLEIFSQLPGFDLHGSHNNRYFIVNKMWFEFPDKRPATQMSITAGENDGTVSVIHYYTQLFWHFFLKTGFLPFNRYYAAEAGPYFIGRLCFYSSDGLIWPREEASVSDNRRLENLAATNRANFQKWVPEEMDVVLMKAFEECVPETTRSLIGTLSTSNWRKIEQYYTPEFLFPSRALLANMVERNSLDLPAPLVESESYTPLEVLDLPIEMSPNVFMEATALQMVFNQNKIRSYVNPHMLSRFVEKNEDALHTLASTSTWVQGDTVGSYNIADHLTMEELPPDSDDEN